ncbi:MAG: hypothetical protein KKG47_12025 [Proteobacteria bacterium]|nr:hypothetical protein [Pseudomonadota bacterium]MBU1738415.1 hypothetical protein [Pseudomonadota bacterium]
MNRKYSGKHVVRESENGLIINRKWFDLKAVSVAIAGGCYAYISIRLLFSFSVMNENTFVLITVYVISASLLAYMLVGSWLNSSRIRLDHELLEIEQWPIPFPGTSKIPATEISYLYVRNNMGVPSMRKKVGYSIHALTHGGRDMVIIAGMDSPRQASRIKSAIAKFLKLVDIPSPICEHAKQKAFPGTHREECQSV